MEKIDLGEVEALDSRSPQRFGALIDEARDRTNKWASGKPGVNAANAGFDPTQGLTWVTRWGEGRTNATFPLAADLGEGRPLLLEWNLRKQKEGPHVGQVVFAAGLTWFERDTHGWSEIGSRVSDYTKRFGKDAFAPYDDELPRLYRWLPPGKLADRNNFENQVEALKGFVVEAFDDLVEALSEV